MKYQKARTQKLHEQDITSSYQFIMHIYIDVQYLAATEGKYYQRLIWHLAAASDIHELQYIL